MVVAVSFKNASEPSYSSNVGAAGAEKTYIHKR